MFLGTLSDQGGQGSAADTNQLLFTGPFGELEVGVFISKSLQTLQLMESTTLCSLSPPDQTSFGLMFISLHQKKKKRLNLGSHSLLASAHHQDCGKGLPFQVVSVVL